MDTKSDALKLLKQVRSGCFINCYSSSKHDGKQFMYGKSYVGQVPFEYVVDMDTFNFYGLEEDYQGESFTTEDMLFQLLNDLGYYPRSVIPLSRMRIEMR